MNLVANLLDGGLAAYDERLAEIRLFSFSAGLLAARSTHLLIAYLLVYILINCNSFQHLSTTSCIPRSSSQLITTV